MRINGNKKCADCAYLKLKLSVTEPLTEPSSRDKSVLANDMGCLSWREAFSQIGATPPLLPPLSSLASCPGLWKKNNFPRSLLLANFLWPWILILVTCWRRFPPGKFPSTCWIVRNWNLGVEGWEKSPKHWKQFDGVTDLQGDCSKVCKASWKYWLIEVNNVRWTSKMINPWQHLVTWNTLSHLAAWKVSDVAKVEASIFAAQSTINGGKTHFRIEMAPCQKWFSKVVKSGKNQEGSVEPAEVFHERVGWWQVMVDPQLKYVLRQFCFCFSAIRLRVWYLPAWI